MKSKWQVASSGEIPFSADGPKHKLLLGTEGYRAVLVGLEAGQRIPSHPSQDAAYHFLHGSGWMLIDGQRIAVEAGKTVAVSEGVPRGVEAETRLAFFGSHGGKGEQPAVPAMPRWTMVAVAALVLLVMVGLMAVGAVPMTMPLSALAAMGLGAWVVMLVPVVGLLGMAAMMVVMIRHMQGSGRGMEGHAHHQHMMSGGNGDRSPSGGYVAGSDHATLDYSISGIRCSGCKETIQRAVDRIPGVEWVRVDVEARQAQVSYAAPATPQEIARVLEEMGYPPD